VVDIYFRVWSLSRLLCCIGSGSNVAATYARAEPTGGQFVTAIRRFVRGRMASASGKRPRVEKPNRAKEITLGQAGGQIVTRGGAAMSQLDMVQFYLLKT